MLTPAEGFSDYGPGTLKCRHGPSRYNIGIPCKLYIYRVLWLGWPCQIQQPQQRKYIVVSEKVKVFNDLW